MTRHKSTLNSSAIVLKAHFLREIGIAGGQQAYDQHTTFLSNRHSARNDAPSFCSTVDLYARMAALASESQFVTMAQAAIDPPASGPCNPAAAIGTIAAPLPIIAKTPEPVATALAATPALPEAAPVAVLGAAAVAAPLPALAAAPAALPVDAPAAMPVSAVVAEPVAVAAPIAVAAAQPAGTTLIAEAPIVAPQTVAEAPAAEAPAAATPGRDSVRALQDAIKALQAATEALAAQQTTPI